MRKVSFFVLFAFLCQSVGGKIVEKGNTMQIWKLIGGRWWIVLDIFKPVPEK